ncbi:MAG TPA: exosome complex RNA-binding protein Csl4 [Candidatus Thermoplasmatota archaeon]|nr:exosome complex RNA-binding protein Csl4 [Candidatus Thermoplasmatota archaeon]
MAEDKALVFPGDEIAIAEEFIPGPGTYEEEGIVYAARLGRLQLDTNEFVAIVKPFTSVPVALNPGDIVIGTVQALRSSMTVVEVRARADQPDRAVAGDTNGTLHIAKTSGDYVSRLEDVFRLGDILRAEVIGVEPSLQLTTKAPHLGVLKAYCPRCRTPMDKKGHGLRCPECDWKAHGKLAEDYGEGLLM